MEDAGTQRRAAHARVALCVLIAVTREIAVQSCTSRPIRGRNVERRVATQMVRHADVRTPCRAMVTSFGGDAKEAMWSEFRLRPVTSDALFRSCIRRGAAPRL